jgi:serine/threonine protein kinase
VSSVLKPADGGRYVAKRIRPNGPDSAETLKHEVSLHRRVSSECASIVRYVFACEAEGELVVLLEACDCILWDAITATKDWKSLASRKIMRTDRLTWSIDLADALRHCHSLRVLHRDINPWNVFLVVSGSTFEVRLGDFGLAACIPEDVEELVGINAHFGAVALDESALGSLYSAPELGKRYSFPADVFSLGMTLLATWFSADSSPGDESAIVENVEQVKASATKDLSHSPRLPILREAGTSIQLLMESMLSGAAHVRPTSLDVYQALKKMSLEEASGQARESDNYNVAATQTAPALTDQSTQTIEAIKRKSFWQQLPRCLVPRRQGKSSQAKVKPAAD